MKSRKIIELILDDVANVYFYLVVFYIASIILSYFIKSLDSFFNWPAFNAIMILLGILALSSEKGRTVILVLSKEDRPANLKKIIRDSALIKKINRLKVFVGSKLDRKGYMKIGVIAIILLYSIIEKIDITDFLILAYALFSILFVIESRVAAFISLILLILIPVQLIEKKEVTAEITAVYVYYFLLISVLIQISEYYKENKNVLKKNK